MSQLLVDDIVNKDDSGAPGFSKGVTVTGNAVVGAAVTINSTGIDISSGIVTATTFDGNATSATNASGLTGTPNIVVGSVTAASGSVSGNFSVAGTLTYEDVTNIDSVGLITARSGINVTGGVITGDGSGLTNLDASPTVQATADGALSAGDPVIVKTDGDVTKVVQTVNINNPPAAGSGSRITTDNMRRPAACYIPDGNKIVYVGHNSNSTNPLESFVGDVTDAGVISWGAVDRFETENVQAMPGLCYDTTNDKVVVLYYASTSNKIWSRVGTISGTSMSWGSRVEVYGVDSNNFRCQRLLFDPTNSKVIALYRAGGSNNPRARVGTVSGTSISWGTESAMNGVESNEMALTYDPDTQRVIGLSKDQSGGRLRTYVGTVSGTDITWGAEAEVVSANGQYPTVAYDTTNNKVVVQYETSDNNITYYKCGTVTGGGTNTISWGSAGQVTTDNVDTQELFFDPFSERLVSFYRYSSDIWVASGTLSGSAITWTSFYKIDDYGISDYDFWCGVILQNGIVASVAAEGSNGDDPYSRTAILGTASSNATTDNFIGFARDAAANDATAKIDVSGAVNANQSGLTAGEKYYVQKNGSLATTEDTPKVFAGTAISATKLIVNDQQPIPTSPVLLWEVLSTHDFGVTAASEFIHRGWTNANYQQFKLVWADLSGGANNTYREFFLQWYISGSDSAQGTLYTADPYYQYFRQNGNYTGTGISGNNGAQRQWRLNNGSGMRWGSGEIVFPATTYNGGGYRPIHAYGRVCSEAGSDYCGCQLAHPVSSSSFLNGVKAYSNGNWTTGRMTWYGLKYS